MNKRVCEASCVDVFIHVYHPATSALNTSILAGFHLLSAQIRHCISKKLWRHHFDDIAIDEMQLVSDNIMPSIISIEGRRFFLRANSL